MADPPKRIEITGGTTEPAPQLPLQQPAQQVSYISKKQSEIAVLTVNGMEFRDWETISVHLAQREHPPYRYRFTCSEAMPISKNFGLLQIKPGDFCTVTLAGQLAVTGKVTTRQVYYDKQRHHIEIQGATITLDTSGASPVTKTMEMKDVTFEQIARQLLKPLNIPFKVEGGQLSQMKFPRVSLHHGMSIFDHLDMYSRAVGASFTSDPQGSFVALAGPGSDSDTVIEGKNILVGREIIYNSSMASAAPALGQQTGNDKKWGADVSHIPFQTQAMQQLGKTMMPFVLPSELPTAEKDQLKGRAGTERDWQAEDMITVFATVYGWLRPSGGLWKCNQMVHVTSPMLIMDMDLKAKSVTFTQDNNEGTRTTLELCNPKALGGDVPQAS